MGVAFESNVQWNLVYIMYYIRDAWRLVFQSQCVETIHMIIDRPLARSWCGIASTREAEEQDPYQGQAEEEG